MLVTGLTGFKGLWLGTWLEALGAQVSGLALPPEPAVAAGWPGLDRVLPCRLGDVRDFGTVSAALRDFRPEVVFHLAAQPLVRRSYAEPVETFATNVMGTAHVLEAARCAGGVRAVVVITTDKCYENVGRQHSYAEADPLGGHDPYSASKACAEIVTAAYRRSYENEPGQPRIASARAGNVIGGGDWSEDRIVPDLVRGLIARRPVVLRRPEAVRPWLHVLEALSGYLMLGARLANEGGSFASAWNFGPPVADAVSVRELARHVVGCWGEGELVEQAVASGPHEARYLMLDATKAAAELGWRPLLTVRERAAWTVEWYRAWRDRPDSAWASARAQVGRYQECCERLLPAVSHPLTA